MRDAPASAQDDTAHTMAAEVVGSPTAAVLIIGAEVLSGKVDDQNAPFLIRALRVRGVELTEIRTIGDSVEGIAEAVNALRGKVSHVFTTGGIGPTHDDVTLQAVARAFGQTLERRAELVAALTERYGDRLNGAALKMAEVPHGARVSLVGGGYVPLVQIGNVMVLPGVPSLMRVCFEAVAHQLTGAAFETRTLFLNASETQIADLLARVQGEHPAVAIGSYPRFDEADHRVRVTVDGRDRQVVEAATAALRQDMPKGVLVRIG